MDVVWYLQFLACVTIAGSVLQRLLDKLQTRLPGPIGVPFLGRLPWIVFSAVFHHHGNLYEALVSDGRQFGDARFLRVGMREVIVLSSAGSIREALEEQGPEFSDRPGVDWHTARRRLHGGDAGWRENRRFSARVLRDLAVEREVTEAQVRVEAEALVQLLTAQRGRAFNPEASVAQATANVACQLVFGVRFGYGDPEGGRVAAMLRRLSTVPPLSAWLPFFFPVLDSQAFLRPQWPDVERQLLDFVSAKVEEIDASFGEDDEPSSYVEAFLSERRRLEAQGSSLFSRRQLVSCATELLLKGSDGAAVLDCALLCMATFRAWQARVHEELERVGEHVTFADRLRCPVTLAVLEEVQRCCPVLSHGLDRAVRRETWFRGCRLSARSTVLADVRAAHQDPEVWWEPRRFNPRRFLRRGEFRPSRNLVPFGVGERRCVGESVARMELFVFFSAVIRRFDVSVDAETERRGDGVFLGTDGPIHALRDHSLIFQPR